MFHPNYPRPSEVDAWCDELWTRADALAPEATLSDIPNKPLAPRNIPNHHFIRFTPGTPGSPATPSEPGRPGPGNSGTNDNAPFFGIWQPVHNGGPAPLLVHLPGYGAEMSSHPHLAAAGFNVLHVGPQGYYNTEGPDTSKQRNNIWPVLPDTVTTLGKRGYRDWLTDALVAVKWARQQPQVQPNRLAFFGTSQGGGTALLLASITRDRGVKAVCADEPYLTGYFMMHGRTNTGAYSAALGPLDELIKATPDRAPEAWRALGFVDTLSHAHRLTMPTLLTAGDIDPATPADTIRALFDRLPKTRSYTEMANTAHGYTVPFGELTRAWCTLYV